VSHLKWVLAILFFFAPFVCTITFIELPACPEDIAKLGEYVPSLEEWPVPMDMMAESPIKAKELYLDRISAAISRLSLLKAVRPFRDPVDLTVYPLYIGFVYYPIDLRTIEERIHNNFYR
jgi:hypothetical protein